MRERQRPSGDLSRSKVSALRAQHSVLCFALYAMLLAFGASARAQHSDQVLRIGYLTGANLSASGRQEAFRQGLRDLGYVEGKNIVIEWRSAEGNRNRQRALASELVRLKVDVIVSGGSSSTRAVKEATSTIPIVMTQDAFEILKSQARRGQQGYSV